MDRKLPYSPLKQAMSAQLGVEADSETSFQAEHTLIVGVCDRLEAIADALPEAPSHESLSELNALLRFGIPAHCRHEEQALKSALESEEGTPGWLHHAAALITAEHLDNEIIMLELAEALEDYRDRGEKARANALGYLIRHFFTQMRRHMAWEEKVIEELRAKPE
ncbi:MAG: hemerythrin domain-containing protein [Minwuia sp.]|nr:hemerythrin domain-containing protein [Minwuia sp.]